VFAKDPNRRKARSGSRTRANGVRAHSKSEKSAPNRRNVGGLRGGNFLLYVEGARDREILECWARRVDPALAKCIESSTIILGGRRPARAFEDFQKRGGVSEGYSGLVVLDRDDHAHDGADAEGSLSVPTQVGLEVFVWSLRHIESYLLVPAAIRRMLRLAADDRSVERFIEQNAPGNTRNDVLDCSTNGSMDHPTGNTSDNSRNSSPNNSPKKAPQQSTPEVVMRSGASLHAKRILGAGGSLSKALGAELRAGDIARAMRLEDLHADIRLLLDRIGTLSGHSVKGPEVVIRSSASPRAHTES
jgi:hypothetical protein